MQEKEFHIPPLKNRVRVAWMNNCQGDKMANTCWEKLISSEMEKKNESWKDVVDCTLSQEELIREFDADSSGSTGGWPFTLWTKNRVYFPIEYDGSEGVTSVPRNPCGEKIGPI
jgi:hypothetical protein